MNLRGVMRMSNYNFEAKEPPEDPTECHLYNSVVIHGEHVTDFNDKLDPDKYYIHGSLSPHEYRPVVMGPFTVDIIEIINKLYEEE